MINANVNVPRGIFRKPILTISNSLAFEADAKVGHATQSFVCFRSEQW